MKSNRFSAFLVFILISALPGGASLLFYPIAMSDAEAAAGTDVWLESLDNGILRETRNGSMWQAQRTKRLRSEDTVTQYLEELNAGEYNDWRLPTKSELYRLIAIFDWKKNGDVKTRIEGDHWLMSDYGRFTVGKWELDDMCGPERIYYTNRSGYVRAIRP